MTTDLEHRYTTLFNAIPACFWEIDFADARLDHDALGDPAHIRALLRAARVVDCNQRAVDVFGRGAKAELLTSIAPFWPEASHPVFARSIAAFLAGQASFTAETTMTTIAGAPREVLFTVCFPRSDATMLIGIVDVSETRQALHDLRQANIRAETLREAQAFSYWELDTSRTNAMMAEVRAQGVTDLAAYMDEHPEFLEAALDATIVTDINQKSLDLYGLADKSQAIGKGIRSYWLPGRYEAFRGSIAAGYNGIPQFQMVTQTCTRDGRVLDCRFWMAAPPEMRANGTVMVAIQDLTEENARRREIEHLREGLAHAGRVLMLGEFTASIAHEINQPLAAVRAAASAAQRWLKLDPPDLDQARASLANIAQSASRAGQIIDRIRGMAVKRKPQRAWVEIRGLVEETIDFLGRELQASGTAVTLDIPRDLPAIHIDRTQIQQVLVNLIVNALQALEQSPQRRIDLTVTALDGKARFTVRDRGPGLDPTTADRLFDHFFTTKQDGMGIGLTICQSIVQAHEGTIAARNVADGGAEFSFTV